jgi:hypothetical protein
MNYLAIHRHQRSMTPLPITLPQRSSIGLGHRLNIAGLPVAYALAIGDRITRIVVGLNQDMPDKFHADDTHDFKACTVWLKNGYFIIDSEALKWIEAWHRILLLRWNTSKEVCEGRAKCGCNGFALFHARNPREAITG